MFKLNKGKILEHDMLQQASLLILFIQQKYLAFLCPHCLHRRKKYFSFYTQTVYFVDMARV